MKFRNDIYQDLIEEILEDIFYEDTHFRTKIALLRHYLEIIVRTLIDRPLHDHMTLNDRKVKVKIFEIETNLKIGDKKIARSIKNAADFLNIYSHTEQLAKATNSDYALALDHVMNVIALFFIIHFKNNQFGFKSHDMESFSILPPEVRYKTLDYLYKTDRNNLLILHKLCLVMLKFKGYSYAINWVRSNGRKLKKLSTYSKKYNFKPFLAKGKEMNGKIHLNMYDHLFFAINYVNKLRQARKVPIYKSFENSYKAYNIVCMNEKNKKSFEKSVEIKEMIEFLFIGRHKE
ncbi:hypothetical protein MXM33_04895 [Acinetobacter vivianii]|uniref:hypothetical protein n=1 Tax=Acinetobacter vivianii TaxID=1776742 RepID=UPI002DBBD5BF|nr:hypothetical protein [Acinetobacter vivianii]MEB6666364.1 hypothetical protein [Acinetobacter vivianii]